MSILNQKSIKLNIFRNKLAIITASILMTTLSQAACLTDLKEGKDYIKVPVATEKTIKLDANEQKSGKPLLVEFFWYGCPHCYHMDPLINKLVAEHKDSIIFKRYPATFPKWESGAKLFFTLEEMGLEKQLHTKVFDTIQKDHINLMDNKVARDKFLLKEKVDINKFDTVYNSFSIASKLRLSKQVADNYKLNSSPVLVVNNLYQVDPGLTNSYEATIKSIDSILKSEKKVCK